MIKRLRVVIVDGLCIAILVGWNGDFRVRQMGSNLGFK
jgi:hypothetical protein